MILKTYVFVRTGEWMVDEQRGERSTYGRVLFLGVSRGTPFFRSKLKPRNYGTPPTAGGTILGTPGGHPFSVI